jgi:hypothetical protein
MDENSSIAEQFGLVQRNGFVPETMIVVGTDFGLGEGTWLLRKGEEPKRLGSTQEFERIWMTELGITKASIEKFS